ncbi:hypothetical protein BC835DRAFT_1413609 [Cytidiella melzeri]|nr:hypothetical protein BC835DRAFT_1413609 [Cytidiella melzeri]
MSIAVDIPQELFQDVLDHVGADDDTLFLLGSQERRDMIRHLTSCSLTCVYWAQACRPRIFRYIRLQSLADLRGLSSLVLSTPQRFTPVSEHIQYVQLVQRLDEKFWLHTLPLQPSYGLGVLFSRLIKTDSGISIVGPPLVEHQLEPLATPRLFAGLPRSLPPHILPCQTLLLENCHFLSLNYLRRSLHPFKLAAKTRLSFLEIHLVNSTWNSRMRLMDALFTGRLLELPSSQVHIRAWDCSNDVDSAWAAFACARQTCRHPTPHNSPLSLHSLDQRIIYEISNTMHQGIGRSTVSTDLMDKLVFEIITGPLAYKEPSYPHITLVDVFPPARSEHGETTPSTVFAWDKMVDLFSSLQGPVQLRFNFDARDDLVQFMEASRTALARFHDRVDLIYEKRRHEQWTVDFVTLEDKGQIYVVLYNHSAWDC